MEKIVLSIFFLANLAVAQSEDRYRVHSHNDYLRNVPFWEALAAGAGSVEADVFLVGDSLYVAHTKEEIETLRTLETLYLQPLQKMLAIGLKHPEKLQLLIDIKSEPYSTLDALIRTFKGYPLITGDDALAIVISGNRPKPSEYPDYPDFILFDYQSLDTIENTDILEKIALISLNFRNYSEWNGEGRLTDDDLKKISSVIEKAHTFKRPFRFWGTPDSATAWKTLVDLGVCYINTDNPFECSYYLKTFGN